LRKHKYIGEIVFRETGSLIDENNACVDRSWIDGSYHVH